jgi:lambda family phage portal protein
MARRPRIIDRVRAFLAPQVRRFDGAAGGRRWDSHPHFGATSTETLAAAAPMRSRARYFVANNAYAANGVAVLVAALVGAGITPASQHPDPETRAALAKLWTDWANVADADGRTDIGGVLAGAVRAMIVDGESFLHLIETRRGLRVRLIPAEQIDESKTVELGGGAYIVAGVEFNAAGERVAYWILPAKPTDVLTYAPSVRVPSADVMHLAASLGAGQVRGVSWLAPILLRLADVDALEDALLVGFKVAALHAGFLTDVNGSTDLPYEGDQSGSVLTSGLEPGTLKRLPAGMDVKFNSPAQAQQSTEFLASQLRALSAGLGVPEFLLTNDVSRSNYSSLRAALIAFKTRIEQWQYGTIIPQVMRPLWERFVTSAVLSGRLSATDFESDVSEYLSAELYPPALPWADPLKDIQATSAAINAGLMSRRQAVAALGYSVEDLDEEIAADKAREAEHGLTFGASPQPRQEEPANAGA